jgi:hypothetical protein
MTGGAWVELQTDRAASGHNGDNRFRAIKNCVCNAVYYPADIYGELKGTQWLAKVQGARPTAVSTTTVRAHSNNCIMKSLHNGNVLLTFACYPEETDGLTVHVTRCADLRQRKGTRDDAAGIGSVSR